MRKWIIPSGVDARWLQLCFLASYVAYALTSPGFSRTPLQYAVGFLATLGVELAALRLKRLPLVPVSGLISTMGLLLLCDSPEVWPYAVVGIVGTLSKHLVRAEGRHVFNPLNFGIVVGLLFLSAHVTIQPGRWGGSQAGMAAIAALGVLTVWRAGKLGLALGYALAFAAAAGARSAITGTPWTLLLAPMTGASFQLFTFFMVTDPMTTPRRPAWSAGFGVAVGLLDGALRHYQVLNAPFLALFALSALVPLIPERVAGRGEWPKPLQRPLRRLAT
jgi:enediyne biosynthesis protein E5